ncbi:hypothetical protein ACWGPD_09540 [Streptomyces hirsutus]|uniref:hypothetical protein n=1 Tax=Streptomyces hirsutus TaxID=35620 RepID=UPI003638F944
MQQAARPGFLARRRHGGGRYRARGGLGVALPLVGPNPQFGEGAFHLDSAWHHGWETVAAVVATTKATTR